MMSLSFLPSQPLTEHTAAESIATANKLLLSRTMIATATSGLNIFSLCSCSSETSVNDLPRKVAWLKLLKRPLVFFPLLLKCCETLLNSNNNKFSTAQPNRTSSCAWQCALSGPNFTGCHIYLGPPCVGITQVFFLRFKTDSQLVQIFFYTSL